MGHPEGDAAAVPDASELLAQLEAQNRRFLNMLDLLPVVIIASRTDATEAEYVSPNVEALLGRTAEEMRDFGAWFSVIHPDDTEIAMNIRTLLDRPGEFSTKGRLMHADGTQRFAEMRMVTRRNPDDAAIRFLITLVDITESERMREQLETSNRFASLSRTTGAFAHEFSSLMQIIIGNLDKLDASAAGEQPIETAREAASRAAGLLGGLVAFAGARPGAIEPVSIPTLCEASHPLFLERLPSNVGMAIDLAPDLPEVVIAPESMRQIMFQLVDNAAESMPDGGTITITVREQPHAACHLSDDVHPGTWVSIAISDHGKGIEPSSLGYVWEPFFTSRTGIARRGAGLGLSIVHGAVHQADGHVTIASRPGAGTTVTVYLPGLRR